MALRDPVAIYNAASNLEAAFVCQLITAAGFEAHTVEDVSLVGQWMFGTLPEIHKPQVWVEREDVEQVKPLLEKYEQQAAQQPSADEQLTIKAVCEECEKPTLFPASRLGAVETCPHCGAYLDVGEESGLDGWEEGGEED